MTQGINADTINEYIHGLAKSTGCSKRKERLELLDQIAEKGKELLDDLNSTDKNVCEIIEDIDNAYEEMLKWQEDVATAEGEVEDSQKSLDDLYKELNPLTQKEANGTLTDAEKVRLKELRAVVAAKEKDCANKGYTLDSLGDGSSFSNILENDFAMLDELTADMEGYAAAGEAIKASANKFGKANMNCEKAMDRNEKSWFAAALGLGGKNNAATGAIAGTATGAVAMGTGAAIGATYGAFGATVGSFAAASASGIAIGLAGGAAGTVGVGAVAIGSTTAAVAVGSTVGATAAAAGASAGLLGSAGALAGAGAACATVPVIGWAAGAALAVAAGAIAINETAYNKFNKYLERMDYTEVGDNSQTFYDSIDHEYVAEYDVLEGKGGNQIGGKMRKATAKVFSYGKTITTAANEIAKKPDAVQAKKTVEENDNS